MRDASRKNVLGLLLAVTVAYCCGGCTSWMYEGSDPPPPIIKPDPKRGPTLLSEVEAVMSLRAYALGVANAFESAATKFEQHVPATQICREMGDDLVPARVDSFMPLMKRLNELGPATDASDQERSAADLARAVQLRKWADQLRNPGGQK